MGLVAPHKQGLHHSVWLIGGTLKQPSGAGPQSHHRSLQRRRPSFSLDNFGLLRKDFGQQDTLDFFITINTAIG